MKTILISGADGFIAGQLARRLKASGLRLVGLALRARPLKFFDSVYQGTLLTPLEGLFEKEKIDAFIHCAYHPGKDELRVNVEGTKLWAEEAKKNGVRLQIFLSSISAREDSFTNYGKSKYETERWFLKNGQVVLRLGLVIGEGGFFKKMVSMMEKCPVIPLLNRGESAVYLTGIEDLCQLIEKIVREEQEIRNGVLWNFFQPHPLTLKEVLKEIKREESIRCFFLPLPYNLVLYAVMVLEKFPFLRLKINSNNIKGLKQNDRLDFDSDFLKLGYQEKSFSELLRMSKK